MKQAKKEPLEKRIAAWILRQVEAIHRVLDKD